VTPQDVVAYLDGSRGLPSKPIVLSFDDGYADFYTTAVPILRSHDFVAVDYVVSGFIGQPGYMSAAQIVSAQGAGFEIGAHTVGHVNLTRQSADGLRYQLTASKDALERLLGHPVLSFCYPYGKFGARESAAVAAAGYQSATTTYGGSFRTLAGRYAWNRLRVGGGESLSQFAFSVQADS
jgi:peptidoglycan/xylan/chitin deacetylase (PgdA/CDA1 family)